MAAKQNLAEKTDEELVQLTINNQDNFVYLIQRYRPKLLRYIVRISSLSNEDAEDLLQEVFIKAYQNLNDFDLELKFSSWIYRITRNQVISNFRKTKARPQRLAWDEENDLANTLKSDHDLEAEIDQSLSREKISEVLNCLDYKYKEVLELKFFEEKDYQEISDIIKKPMGTVATLINRAKKKFLAELKRQKIKI